MDYINLHTSFGGKICLENHLHAGWRVEIYAPRDYLNPSPRQMLVPCRYFKSKSGAMNFIKRTVTKYVSVMGEIID
jgi:hypothetical protein